MYPCMTRIDLAITAGLRPLCRALAPHARRVGASWFLSWVALGPSFHGLEVYLGFGPGRLGSAHLQATPEHDFLFLKRMENFF